MTCRVVHPGLLHLALHISHHFSFILDPPSPLRTLRASLRHASSRLASPRLDSPHQNHPTMLPRNTVSTFTPTLRTRLTTTEITHHPHIPPLYHCKFVFRPRCARAACTLVLARSSHLSVCLSSTHSCPTQSSHYLLAQRSILLMTPLARLHSLRLSTFYRTPPSLRPSHRAEPSALV